MCGCARSRAPPVVEGSRFLGYVLWLILLGCIFENTGHNSLKSWLLTVKAGFADPTDFEIKAERGSY
jgi:hypothetical protein